MQSPFSSQTLAEIFRDLYLSERSGVLVLSRDGEEKRLYFERGLIHYAESTAEDEQLGPWLLREGKISRGAIDEAQSDRDEPGGLARGLLNRGLITKETLGEALGHILECAVRSVFRWEGGAAQFSEAERVVEFCETDVLRTFELILRGIFDMVEFEAIGEAMQGLDNRLRPRRPSPVPLERMTLSPAHGFILSRVDGSTNVKDVLSILPDAEGDGAARFIFGLLVMGVLEYDPPLGEGPFKVANILRDHADRRALERMQEQTIRQVYTQIRTQNPHEVLGVTPSASREAIERAYEQAKGLFHRDRLLPKVRDGFRAELAVIESRLIEAYLRLTQAENVRQVQARRAEPAEDDVGAGDLLVRVEMDKTKSKLAMEKASQVADNYYAKARKAVREGDYHNAIQYGKLAISYNETDARFYFMLADCQVRNPGARWQHQAEQNYTKAAELDPWNADYRLSLGRFYKKRGLKLRARRQFEEVLKLVPEHKLATEELSSLR
jgi:tetratricopeptide (TPR) repeat protein